jgi:putative lipoic acid-binding regulatory protein
MTDDEHPELYPYDYTVKAMGLNTPGFDALVLEVVRRHARELGEAAVRSRESRDGKYVSVSITIRAENRAQLDALYADLDAESQVLLRL